MSMDKAAVQHIQETANIPALIEQASNAGTLVPVVTLPSGMSLESLESYMEHASRYRLSFKTNSIPDFIEYNEMHDKEGATCFVSSKGMSAESVYDLGTVEFPGHKKNTAGLSLKKTAAYKALCNIDGDHLHQKAAGEFLEDWADNMTVTNKDGKEMTVALAVQALQSLTIETAREIKSTVSDFGESMDAMAKIEAKNQNSIPSRIEFKCETYTGLSERVFTLRVGILTGGDKPAIVFRILRHESIEEEMTEEFKNIIVESSKELSLKAFIGDI